MSILRLRGGVIPPSSRPPQGLLCDAIARKVCVTATHKGKLLKLAPHVVFHRNTPTDYLVDAVTLERDGKAPNKPKLDRIKVAELESVTVTNEAFAPDPGFDPAAAEYAGKTVCVVQVV